MLHSEICGSPCICHSPQLIAAYRVLRRLPVPRHSPCALSHLTFYSLQIPLVSRIILSSFSYLSAIVVFYPLTKIKKLSLNFCKTLLCFCLPLLSRLIQFSRFSKVSSPYLYDVVGSNGFEPSTSRLSGARSSLLSYEPMYHRRVALVVEMKRFELSTSCVQGRRSPN